MDLKTEANKFKWLTYMDIKTIIEKNSMSGYIETGLRFWVMQSWNMPYGHKLDIPGLCRYLMELSSTVDNCSCYPIEKSQSELTDRIIKISKVLIKYHKSLL